MDDRFTISLIVNNQYGVLNRIAGLFSKRCYNIDSLAVGETENPKISRMTIVSTGGEYIRTQIVRQLNKLHDVKHAIMLEEADSVSVEHLLIKLKTDGNGNSQITELLNRYGGKIMYIGDRFIIADLTGPTENINKFIVKCIPLGIIELCRSGSLSLSKNADDVLNINENI
ncbi:MAG: Acetolactate synthase small subunit [Firmicutes bacterium ADurb.Bin300]|jgi:acetolactate synthase-1/3 small subunit|nr:MAG: Acetolactate synthase small subunit [Firmicutes bacterium ADurb.Bin300]HOD02348.1 acetolactate synthase small subunit [Clostridiales bacterium]